MMRVEKCILGKYKLVYMWGEGVDREILGRKLGKMEMRMIRVEEREWMWEWGYELGGGYVKMGEIGEVVGDVGVVGVRGSGRGEVVKDMEGGLDLGEKNVLGMRLEGKKVGYIVGKREKKSGEVLDIVGRMGGSGIV